MQYQILDGLQKIYILITIINFNPFLFFLILLNTRALLNNFTLMTFSYKDLPNKIYFYNANKRDYQMIL